MRPNIRLTATGVPKYVPTKTSHDPPSPSTGLFSSNWRSWSWMRKHGKGRWLFLLDFSLGGCCIGGAEGTCIGCGGAQGIGSCCIGGAEEITTCCGGAEGVGNIVIRLSGSPELSACIRSTCALEASRLFRLHAITTKTIIITTVAAKISISFSNSKLLQCNLCYYLFSLVV